MHIPVSTTNSLNIRLTVELPESFRLFFGGIVLDAVVLSVVDRNF